MGRLVQVLEPDPNTGVPSLETDYAYDALGNLRAVNQHGTSSEAARNRTFQYDGLSRLTSSTNPETGTIGYGYDANGNLTAKVDDRGVTVNNYYDALNRLITTTYSDGITPSNYYTYDVAPGWMSDSKNVIGRLANSSNSFGGGTSGKATAATYSYDAMGRILRKWQQTPSASPGGHFVSSKYDFAGNLTDLTYPNGYHVVQTWDTAGRLATSNLVDVNGTAQSQNYLQAAQYYPDDTSYILTLGNGVQETFNKNKRLQIKSITVGTAQSTFLSHSYCYSNQDCTSGGTANNGNIWQVSDVLNSALTQNFTYDALNRIRSFSVGGTPYQDIWQYEPCGSGRKCDLPLRPVHKSHQRSRLCQLRHASV
jgi:YD repeat-containing protein